MRKQELKGYKGADWLRYDMTKHAVQPGLLGRIDLRLKRLKMTATMSETLLRIWIKQRSQDALRQHGTCRKSTKRSRAIIR